jgi:mannose-6-phosphate isomerase-like protein (cupin superfamily)
MAKEIEKEKNTVSASAGNRGVLSGAHDYFVNNVLPNDIKTCVRHVKSKTLYVNNHDETFLFVRAGKGKLIVNAVEYDLSPNTLVNLGPFHRYRYLPAPDSEMEIVECRTNPGTYVYMIANPYFKLDNFTVPSEPPVVHLKGIYADIANESMDGLLKEMDNKSTDCIPLCFCYLTDLFGLITEKLPKAYYKTRT